MSEQQNELQRRKRRSFTQIDNEIVNNEEISWQAKGMMLYLLSKPDGWSFYEKDLTNRATNGKDSVRSIIKELLDYGYLKRGKRLRNDKGNLGGYKYVVEDYLFESYDGKSYIGKSKVGKSYVGKSKVGNPYVGKSAHSNTKSLSNTKSFSNTENNNKTKEQSSLSSEIFKFYESEFGPLTPFVSEEIEYMIKDCNEELALEALKKSVLANKRSIKYASAITRNWKNENIKTLADLQANENMKGREQHGINQSSSSQKNVADDEQRRIREEVERRSRLLHRETGNSN
ncbi:DnaD domain-containing protein [Kurthia populi]|uniref:DnaD domain-containing protein n=1 Tax=Kurthia populi TaxID=1562132 RepID=A0ABW5XZK3_9BACL